MAVIHLMISRAQNGDLILKFAVICSSHLRILHGTWEKMLRPSGMQGKGVGGGGCTQKTFHRKWLDLGHQNDQRSTLHYLNGTMPTEFWGSHVILDNPQLRFSDC